MNTALNTASLFVIFPSHSAFPQNAAYPKDVSAERGAASKCQVLWYSTCLQSPVGLKFQPFAHAYATSEKKKTATVIAEGVLFSLAAEIIVFTNGWWKFEA